MPSTAVRPRPFRNWGESAQREYTRSRMCPGPQGGTLDEHGQRVDIEPHFSRWWRWVDRYSHQDPDWHCCACGYRAPEVSPIDGSQVEAAVPRSNQRIAA